MPPSKARRDKKKAKESKKAKQSEDGTKDPPQHKQDPLPVWYFDASALDSHYSFDHWRSVLCSEGIAALDRLPAEGLPAETDSGTLVIVRENSIAAGSLRVHGAKRINHSTDSTLHIGEGKHAAAAAGLKSLQPNLPINM